MITVVVCLIAYFNNSSSYKHYRLISYGDIQRKSFNSIKAPWRNILIISLILSLYSYNLGIPEGMPDRAKLRFNRVLI